MSNYCLGELVKRYEVTVTPDRCPMAYDWPEWIELHTFAGERTITDVSERDVWEWAQTHGKGRDEIRFIVADGEPGYSQGDYGYALATSWGEALRGVVTVDVSELGDIDARGAANAVLAEYSAWCRGDVFVVTVTDETGDIVDECGGCIGEVWAMEAAGESFTHWNPATPVPTLEVSYP